jgi:hypothetical protein
MRQNMGKTDRIIRAVVGLLAIIASFLVSTITWQIVLWVVAAIMLITASLGICLLYLPFHFSTKK